MMPFAWLLNFEGVRSGMSATTGDRQVDITKLKIMTTAIRLKTEFVSGINKNKTAQTGMPISMYGILLPKRVTVLSDRFPNIGWNIAPKTLSIAMIAPIAIVCPIVNKLGIILTVSGI